MKRLFYIIIILFLSCNPINKDMEKLIENILNQPNDTKEIIYRSKFKLSNVIDFSLKRNPKPLIDHFNKFNKSYKLYNSWSIRDRKNHNLFLNIKIFDDKDEIWAVFQFCKKNNKNWYIWTITIPD